MRLDTRLAISGLIAGFAFGIIGLFAPYVWLTMPRELAVSGLVIGGILILVSFAVLAWPHKKKADPTTTAQLGTTTPSGYEIPTRQQLKHQIGVDIQRFYKQFESIERQHDEDLEYYYTLAMKQLEQIRDRHSPHANLILQETLIPRALDRLYGEMKRYHLYLSHWRNGRQEKFHYLRNDLNVPEYVGTNIDEAADQIRSAKYNILQLVGEIVDASRDAKP